MWTIAIVNEKGGTGKTTTAVNLSAALGELGRKVLLVDLDGQAASSRWLGVEEDTSFADALLSGTDLKPLEDVIPGVSLAPGSGKLDSVAHDLRPTQGGQLRKLLSQVSGFDYIMIDCPPSLGNRLIGNALLAASHAIVPVETSILALDGLKILLTTIEDIRDGFGHEIALAGVLACRFDARTKLSRFILTELNRALPGKVFKTVIRENVRIRECPGSGQSVLTYAPDSHAAEDYRSLAEELLAMPSTADQPVTAGEQPSAGELTEKEHLAVAGMREQVNTMLRNMGTRETRQAFAVAAAAQESDQKETAEPESPAADEGEHAAASAPSVQDEEFGQHEQTEAETGARPDQTWDFRPAEQEGPATGEASGRDREGWESGPPEGPVPVHAEPGEAPSPSDAEGGGDEPAWEEPAAVGSQPETDQSSEAGPPGGETPSDAEVAQQEDQSPEVAPVETEELAEETAPPEQEPSAQQPGDEGGDYPALRAILQKLAGSDEPGQVEHREPAEAAQGQRGDHSWRRIFRKRRA